MSAVDIYCSLASAGLFSDVVCSKFWMKFLRSFSSLVMDSVHGIVTGLFVIPFEPQLTLL